MPNKPLGPVVADIEGIELSQCDREVLLHPQLGGLIFFSRNYHSREQLKGLVRCIREVRPELLLTVDHEGGRVQRFRDGFTHVPAMGRLRELLQVDEYQCLKVAQCFGAVLASELLDCDIDLSFTPVLDLDEEQSRVIGDRAFSSNADHVVRLAGAFIEGMHSAGMVATAKHFPGHGGVIEDSHLELPIDNRGFDTIWNRDCRPFATLADKYQAVMTAHVVFPDVDDQPVSFSNVWIQDILRQKVGFTGVVFSDDLSMKGAAGIGDMTARALKSLSAGCDAVLICNVRDEAERCLEDLEKQEFRALVPGRLSALTSRHSTNKIGSHIENAVTEDLSALKARAEHYMNKYF